MARCRGQLRGPPAQGGFGSRITLPLPFPWRHPPESRERPPQVTGWDRGVHDQRRAARGLGSRDRLTQPRAVSGSPGFGRRGPGLRRPGKQKNVRAGTLAPGPRGWPGRPTPIPPQGARTHLARVALHGNAEFRPPVGNSRPLPSAPPPPTAAAYPPPLPTTAPGGGAGPGVT